MKSLRLMFSIHAYAIVAANDQIRAMPRLIDTPIHFRYFFFAADYAWFSPSATFQHFADIFFIIADCRFVIATLDARTARAAIFFVADSG